MQPEITPELDDAWQEFCRVNSEVWERWAPFAQQCGDLWLSGTLIVASFAFAPLFSR